MRAEKLKKLAMPSKPAAEKEAEQDLMMLGEEDMIPEEESLEDGMEMEMEAAEASKADMLSDDELLAELKKRGLMSKSSPIGAAAESDIVVDEEVDYADLPEGGEPEKSVLAKPMKKQKK